MDDIQSENNTKEMLRCEKCRKLLAEKVSSPWAIMCMRCKHMNRSKE